MMLVMMVGCWVRNWFFLVFLCRIFGGGNGGGYCSFLGKIFLLVYLDCGEVRGRREIVENFWGVFLFFYNVERIVMGWEILKLW